MTQPLYIPPNIYDQLITICINTQPNQAGGFLVGKDRQLFDVIQIKSDVTDTLQALFNAPLPPISTEGLTIIGYFHSRLNAPPVPSPQDAQQLASLNSLHIVVSLQGTKPKIGAWQIGESVEYVPIVFDLDQYVEEEFRLSSWTQKQNIAMIIITTLSIIALIILSIILLPPAP